MEAAKRLAIPAALLVVTLLLYLPVSQFQFVNYDDPDYVKRVSIAQAVTSVEGANWFPLTRLSHSADVVVFGMDPGRHHVVNVVLHGIAAVLFYLAFVRMTGDRWRALFIAAAFAIHPVHVESVAWIAERKDVLCALFFALGLLAYAEGRTWLVYVAFAAALVSKPMAVTFPLVLLLVDYWPLKRPLAIRSKLPLFAMSAATALATFHAQRAGGAVLGVGDLGLGVRFANALVSLAVYAGKFVWPSNLAVFYPFRAPEAWQVAVSVAVLVVVTVLARRRREWLAGWLWFVVMLLPVIGVVQVGVQARADRYTYLPYIGLAIMVAWTVPVRWLAIPCMLWGVVTWQHLPVWRDSGTLFAQALRVTAGNYVAHNNLGVFLRRKGEFAEAVRHFQAAVEIRPEYGDAQDNLGEALLRLGRLDEAEAHIRAALALEPSPQAHVNLGTALSRRGQTDAAEREYVQALAADPNNSDFVDARYNLGQIYGTTNRPAEASAQFREVIRFRPADAEAHYNLGIAYGALDRLGDAIDEFREAIMLRPDYVNAHFNLGAAFATRGDWNEAAAEFAEAVRLRPDFEEARRNLDYCQAQKKDAPPSGARPGLR